MDAFLTDHQRHLLLDLARTTITETVRGRQNRPVCPDPEFSRPAGCFVTIKQHGRLRGCIGTFNAVEPLWKNVTQMAAAAATGDPRFYPMQEPDLAEFELEISILSPMRRVGNVAEIEVGRHGLYIEKGSYRGVLLPQVATEYGWDRLTFLRQTCLKAGLPPEAWEADDCRIQLFSAEVFGEKEPGETGC